MDSLFDIPACAGEGGALLAGGFGTGHFAFDAAGRFHRWRMHPGLPERDVAVSGDRFALWCSGPGGRVAVPLQAPHVGARRRTLFPFTWTDYALPSPSDSARHSDPGPPVQLSSLAFSPLVPGSEREAGLPVHLVVWRVRGASEAPLEVSLMLTWACGWPDPVRGASFDMQHDRLCLTGSLGDPASADRVGIAVPDLYSEGIYQQGVEPWSGSGAATWEDFAEDGELDAVSGRTAPLGAAAWVKFALAPGERKEIPFVIVWSFPVYESGPAEGRQRHYTRHLEKRRPDNAVVWLAEEAVKDFGADSANYRYWSQQIADWQHDRLADPGLTAEPQRRRFAGLGALLEADTVWTADGRFGLAPRPGQSWDELRRDLGDTSLFAEGWPDLAAQLPPELRP